MGGRKAFPRWRKRVHHGGNQTRHIHQIKRALQRRGAFCLKRWTFGAKIGVLFRSFFLVMAWRLRAALLAQTPAHAGTVQHHH